MQKGFRRGDLVEVRSTKEILATLDKDGSVEALPFMTEMTRYCGRRFMVDKRVEKVCDTIQYTGSRRMLNTVVLEDLRCDGSAHDGCQADCRFFWKESWLRPVAPGAPPAPSQSGDWGNAELVKLMAAKAKRAREEDGKTEEVYRCQATELFKATPRRLRVWNPFPYLREFTSGNIPIGPFIRICVRAVLWEPLRKLGIIPKIPLKGTCTGSTPDEVLALQPGDWVQVKRRDEIADTLTPDGRTRGLAFVMEMLPSCGGTYRVRQRVKRFIDDRNGRMTELKRECVTLEGVFCKGDRSMRRWFCPRAVYPYWRETWLRRVNVESPSPSEERMHAAKS